MADEPKPSDHVEQVTQQQTTDLKSFATKWGYVKVIAIPVLTVILSMLGYKLVPTTPTPLPDAIKQIEVIVRDQAPLTEEEAKARLLKAGVDYQKFQPKK